MRLYLTPLSHFSRKVRLLLDHFEAAYETVDVGNVAGSQQDQFAGNPMMSVPVLEDGEHWLVDSDHIAGYLTRQLRPDDPYAVLTNDPEVLNARAILNGVMASEVRLILAARTGLETLPQPFFQKALATIEQGLAWLEVRSAMFSSDAPSYLDFHLVSAWDHLAHYDTLPLCYPNLGAVVAALGQQPQVAKSQPS